MTNSYTAWSTYQAYSWWLWYMECNDVIIVDIGGQALDILHCTESVQEDITVKAHTHTHTLTFILTFKQNSITAKAKTHQT